MTLELNSAEIIAIVRKHVAASGICPVGEPHIHVSLLMSNGEAADTVTAFVRQSTNSPSQILATVCQEYAVTAEAVLSHVRTEQLVTPRHTAISLMHLSGMTLSDVGRFLNNRDHNTAGNAIENVCDWLETDPEYAQRFRLLASTLGLDPNELRRRASRLKQPQIAAA